MKMPANCHADVAVWIYIITILVCFYGSGLFFWWWIKKGSASAVYIYVTLLLFGQGFQAVLSLQARFLWLSGQMEIYKEFLCSWAWHSRTVLALIACTAIVFHMTYRAITNRDLGKKYEK
jgi:hypothetical protein